MTDYTYSKTPPIPDSTWGRLEPLITPGELTARWLFGVPLVSAVANPITKKVDVMTDALLLDLIQAAVSDLETSMHIYIMPTAISERLAFDKNEFESFGYFRLTNRPVASVESLKIVSSSGTEFFNFPMAWLEMGNAMYGQINILPLSPANTNFAFSSISGGGPAGLVYMSMLKNLQWIPAYWTCAYTAGWVDGLLPRVVNDLIGMQAALNILSSLATTYAHLMGTSLGIDGMSQSVSMPGPNIFSTRIKELEEKKRALMLKVRKKLGAGFVVGNV